MFLRSTVGAGVGPWRCWLLPPDLAAPAAGCFRFELAHVRVLSIVGFSRYQTSGSYGEEQLDLRALPNRRGSWRHRRVGPCGSYGDSARLLATRPPGSWRRSAARSAVARGVSWLARAWVVPAWLLAGAAPLKLAQGGGTGDLRGGWDWVGFRAGSKRKQKTIQWSHFAVVVIVISVESSAFQLRV
jgi:hypothetical protein